MLVGTRIGEQPSWKDGAAKAVAGSSPAPTALEDTAEWLATGFERRGMFTHGGSIPLSSAEIHDRLRSSLKLPAVRLQ